MIRRFKLRELFKEGVGIRPIHISRVHAVRIPRATRAVEEVSQEESGAGSGDPSARLRGPRGAWRDRRRGAARGPWRAARRGLRPGMRRARGRQRRAASRARVSREKSRSEESRRLERLEGFPTSGGGFTPQK